MPRRILLLPPWDPVLCSRIWGTVWQADGRRGQNMYKDTVLVGQVVKHGNGHLPHLLISRSYFAFPFPDDAHPLVGA